MYERIVPAKPIYVVLANSGITYNTALLDVHVKDLINNNAELLYSRLIKITGQAYDMRKAIEKGDLKEVGKIMIENQKLLKEMDFSHKKLDELCARSISMGAYGAKLTGGGKGGYMVALVKDTATQKKIAAKFESEKIPVITAQLGINAVDNVKFRLLK